MNIGLDARAIGGRMTGDRTYWRGLIHGLGQIDTENRYFLFLRRALEGEDQIALPDNFEIIVSPAPNDRIWSLATFGQAMKHYGIDIAHVQYTVPPSLKCKVVTTVHDISFHLFPKLFSFKDRLLLNFSIPRSLRRADAIITVSESSRRDILRAYPFVAQNQVVATHLGVGPEFKPLTDTEQISSKTYLAERYSLTGDYILSVGVLQPRKNLPMLVAAFVGALKRTGFDHKLAIVGKVGWLSAETEEAIGRSGADVLMLGYVPDHDLPLLYGCADIMTYPSLYEGFGLPVLEAMACGCPVITSDSSSLPEVVGEAGILLSAENCSSWEAAMIQLAENASLRSRLRKLGLQQSSRFSWVETATKTLQVYRSLSVSS